MKCHFYNSARKHTLKLNKSQTANYCRTIDANRGQQKLHSGFSFKKSQSGAGKRSIKIHKMQKNYDSPWTKTNNNIITIQLAIICFCFTIPVTNSQLEKNTKAIFVLSASKVFQMSFTFFFSLFFFTFSHLTSELFSLASFFLYTSLYIWQGRFSIYSEISFLCVCVCVCIVEPQCTAHENTEIIHLTNFGPYGWWTGDMVLFCVFRERLAKLLSFRNSSEFLQDFHGQQQQKLVLFWKKKRI